MQNLFLALDRSRKTPYNLKADAQIEPTHPEDPEEIYRMRRRRRKGQDLFFDAVFYPDRTEILGTAQSILIGKISKEDVRNPVDLAKWLEALKPHIAESMNLK